MADLLHLRDLIAEFAADRNWQEFHTPKNLVLALVGECGELSAEFQWLSDDQAKLDNLNIEKLKAIELEIADVAIYLIRLADILDIDIYKAVNEKMKINNSRFPKAED